MNILTDKAAIKDIAVGGAVVGSIVFILVLMTMVTINLISTPEVVMSYSSEQCVEVVIKGETLSCDHMPDQYTIRWIR